MKTLRISALSLLVSLVAFAQADVTKEVTGQAAIINNDKLKAEESARQDALRQAVEQVAGVTLSSNSTALANQIVRDQIYSQSVGYVKSYDVVSKKEEAGVMAVTVKATISAGKLDADLAAVKGLINRLSNRKMVILIQEQTSDQGGKVITSDNLATELTKAMKADGWKIIDEKFAAGKLDLASTVSTETSSLKKTAELVAADYILYGSVAFQQHPDQYKTGNSPQNLFPVSGQWTLTLFSTDSGSQLAKVNGKTGPLGDASKKLGKNVGLVSYDATAYDVIRANSPELVSAIRSPIVEELRRNETDGKRVVLKATNIPDFAALKALTRALSENVKGLTVEGDPRFAKGEAAYELRLLGSTSDLAEALDQKTIKGRKLVVVGSTNDTVEVTLAK